MNRPRIHLLVTTVLLCLLVLTACGGGGGTTPPPTNPTITSVTVTCASQSVVVSGSVQCTATVQGNGNFSRVVTWSASAGSISTSGVYTAPATAPSQAVTITATSSADATKSGTANISVTATPVTVTSVTPTCVKNTAWTGDTVQCSATVNGTGNPSQSVTWSADKGSITPSGGLFTASVAGTATITATSVADNTKKGTFQIAVTQSAVTSVTVNCASSSVVTSGTVQCNADVVRTGNAATTVTWIASAGSISTGGLFTAPATVPSQAVVITAKSTFDQTKTGTANITVTAAPPAITGVTLTCPELSLPQLLLEKCTATVQGTGAYNQNVNWSASAGSISGGTFTAPATSGPVTITATAAGDLTKSDTETVTITTPQTAAFDYKGITHVSWGADEYSSVTGKASQDVIAATNFNWAGVLVTQYMQTATSNTIAPVSWTPSDDAVIAAITELRAKGLKVMLKPHVDVQDGTWRGQIAPTDDNAWFASFTTFITHYADIAEKNHVEMLCFGTEYVSMTSSHATEWGNVISAIRAVYSGKLAYAANASSTDDEFGRVVFWDQVDVIGLDGYFSLTNHAGPTISELVAAWTTNKNNQHIVSTITTFANAHSTKPVIFTEIGYRSAAGANMAPWDWQVSGGVDNIEQQNCYEAMFRVWSVQNGFPIKGYFLWAWPVNPPADGDTDYNPRNKPAQRVLLNWQ